MKKILVVCGTLYRRTANEVVTCGSDITLETYIDELSKNIDQIDVITLCRDNLPKKEAIIPNITIYRVYDNDVGKIIKKLHSTNKYDLLLTQYILSDIAIKVATSINLICVFIAMSVGFKINMSVNGDYPVKGIIAGSKYIAKQLSKQYHRKVDFVITPTGGLSRVITKTKDQPHFDITMFNPTEVKGGNIFFELVKILPKYNFRVVKGWTNLKVKDNYDPYLMMLMEKAHTGQSSVVYFPKDPTIPILKNLTVSEPSSNVGEFFQNTKLLLVPSQWEECYPRVIIEAGLNRKFVLASKIAGIPEVFNEINMPKDFLVDNYKNISSWKNKIEWFFTNYKNYDLPKYHSRKSNIYKLLTKYINS